MKSFEVKELSHLLGGKLIGNTNIKITEPEHIEMAKESSITFIGENKYLDKWKDSKAAAAIVSNSLLDQLQSTENKALICVENSDLAMAKLLELFAPDSSGFEPGIHRLATVHPTAKFGHGITVGANCFIGKNVKIGDNTVLFPNTTILDNAIIGNNTIIKSGTVISERCEIGDHCILHSNVNIGTDGFGYRPSEDGKSMVKIIHIGNVVLGNDVEIGSGTCVDRGKFSSTTIGDGTKIDNLVQIGHNCKIGKFCLISGCSGISGSVTVGDRVIIAGQVGIKDHVKIGNGAIIGAKSAVFKDIPDGETVLGIPAGNAKQTLKKWAALSRLVDKG